MTRIALALGGGGARGLAHIPLLTVFDELGVRPDRMAGASMGGLIAAAYAGGMSAAEIRDRFREMAATQTPQANGRAGWTDLRKWLQLVELNIGRGGLMRGDSIRSFLADGHIKADFAALAIPLRLVAADLADWNQVVLESGDLPLALQATMAVPGVFMPVAVGGRRLIDGSAVNPVPYDLWGDDCEIRIAIDVAGQRSPGGDKDPRLLENVFNAIQIMQRAILNAKIAADPPEVLIRPDLLGVRMFEFFKAEQIYTTAEPAKDSLKRALDQLLAHT